MHNLKIQKLIPPVYMSKMIIKYMLPKLIFSTMGTIPYILCVTVITLY